MIHRVNKLLYDWLNGALDRFGYTVLPKTRHPSGLERTAYPDFEHDAEVILDVGANVGQTCIALTKQFPGVRIFSFEPVNATFVMLVQNTRQYPNTSCCNFAIGDRECEMQLYLQNLSVANSLVPEINRQEKPDQKTEKVTVRTIDNFCHENGISKIGLLKTDTEGFDEKVLLGARKMLSANAIRYVFSEVAFDREDHQHTEFLSIHRFLSDYGFELLGFYEPMYLNCKPWYANALWVNRNANPRAAR